MPPPPPLSRSSCSITELSGELLFALSLSGEFGLTRSWFTVVSSEHDVLLAGLTTSPRSCLCCMTSTGRDEGKACGGVVPRSPLLPPLLPLWCRSERRAVTMSLVHSSLSMSEADLDALPDTVLGRLVLRVSGVLFSLRARSERLDEDPPLTRCLIRLRDAERVGERDFGVVPRWEGDRDRDVVRRLSRDSGREPRNGERERGGVRLGSAIGLGRRFGIIGTGVLGSRRFRIESLNRSPSCSHFCLWLRQFPPKDHTPRGRHAIERNHRSPRSRGWN